MSLVKCGKVTNLVLFVFHKVSKLKSPEELYLRILHSVSFLIQSECGRSLTLVKRRLWRRYFRCFPVNFAKFVRTSFFTEHLWATPSALIYTVEE